MHTPAHIAQHVTHAQQADAHLVDAAQRILAAARNASKDAWFGDRKVFLCAIPAYALDLSTDEGKALLWELHATGLVRLCRADLVAAMDQDMVADSELVSPSGGMTAHFIVLA